MTVASIATSLSHKRLSTYLNPPVGCRDHASALGVYVWNQQICEVMSSVFHTIEIALRNAIYDSYLAYVKKKIATHDTTNIPARVISNPEMWFMEAFRGCPHPKAVHMLKSCTEAEGRLATERKTLTPENYVAKLSLGFWVNLVDRNGLFSVNANNNVAGLYLWPAIRSEVFPNATKSDGLGMSIPEISAELSWFNQLRNRLAHHEPLWKGKQQYDIISMINKVINDYQRCLKLIDWINPSMKRLLEISENHKKLETLCIRKTVDEMITAASVLDARPKDDLLANLQVTDETRFGVISRAFRNGNLKITVHGEGEFFASRNNLAALRGDHSIGRRVKFTAGPALRPGQDPYANKVKPA